MSNSDPKLFMLSGFFDEDVAEKEDLENKIRGLGGEVLDDETWHQKCTHVIAKDFAKISEKIMAGLAAGRWVVTKRYVEKSHRKGSWENPIPYVAEKIILFHKRNWSEKGQAGGCFHNMKVILLLEDQIKCEVYARVVRAGDGVVLDHVDIDMMAEGKIEPSCVTHVFLDPGVINEGHRKHDQFIKWLKICRERGGKPPWHLHYKFLVYLVRRPMPGLSEKNYDIYDAKVQNMSRAEIAQRGKQAGKRISAPQTNGVGNKKQKISDVQEVIALDDSDDDIQVLEERMEKEAEERRLEGGSRRYVRRDKTRVQSYKKKSLCKVSSLLGKVNEVVELDESDDDDVVTLDSDEDMDTKEKGKSLFKKRSISPGRGEREGEMEVDQDERVDSEDEDRDVMEVEEVVKETREAAPRIFDISDDEDDRRSSIDSDIVDISPSKKRWESSDDKVDTDIVDISPSDDKDDISSTDDKVDSDIEDVGNKCQETIASEIETFAKQMVASQEKTDSVEEPSEANKADSDITPSVATAIPTHSVPSNATAGISRGLLQAITSLQPPVKGKEARSSQSSRKEPRPLPLIKSDRDKVSPLTNKASGSQIAQVPQSVKQTEKIAHDSQNRISESASDIIDIVPKPNEDLIKPNDEPLKIEGKMVAAPLPSKSTPVSAASTSSKKSGRKMFREKLKNLMQQNGEEKGAEMTTPKDPKIDTFVPSIVRAPPSPEPVKKVVTIPVERPLQPLANVTIDKSNKGHQSSSILHRAIATLLDRQDRTDECIAISNTNCRTARFDKAGEVAKLERIKVKPMKAIVIEEFSKSVDAPTSSNFVRTVDAEDDLDAGLDLHGKAPDEFVLLPRLRDLRILTCYSSYPTSAILNTVIKQYCLDQKSILIAREAYEYLDHFLFLHLGKDPKDRVQWLNLIMSSLRNCDESMIDVFSLENNQDLHGCWLFFKDVLSRVEKETNNKLLNENKDEEEDEEEESVTGPGLIFEFLVKVLQRDFEIWWKHFRNTDSKEDIGYLTHPMLFYVLGGSKNLLNHASKSVLGLFKTLLMSGGDLSNVRKLIAMVALLFSYNDSREESAWLRGGEKLRWASAVKKIFSSAQLSGNNLFIELSLLQPNWLSVLVSQELVKKEEKPVVSLQDLSDKFSQLEVSKDGGLVASMDNLAHRMCGFLHYHTIFRNIWHHSKKDVNDLDTFRYMNKLLSRGHKSTEKTIKFKSDVQVNISELVADMNTLREFVNEGMKEEVGGSLPALLFRMTTVTQF